jgi:uncharacterized C2H2 Zn-finger protein
MIEDKDNLFYKCPSCDDVYGSWLEGRNCCDVILVYQCRNCEMLYEDSDKAEECCQDK